ncbi:dynein regulatory complex subunit 2-like [Opisthocomus hoazin]|uniref:dynein regulatory complex subunit 2-like n=1 Tax=Opisthocomus hoazin TaxID=30419 RepID=UPI003F52C2DF
MAGERRPRAAAPAAGEDGLLLLQSQALAQEEAAKAKGEMLARFLKDKLPEEEQSSALNLRKLRTQWRAVLREAKAEELREDVEILSRTFARVMACKDSVIEASEGRGGRPRGPPLNPPTPTSTVPGRRPGAGGGAAWPGAAQPPPQHRPPAAAPALPPELPGAGLRCPAGGPDGRV